MQNLPDIRAVQEYWLDAWQRSVLFLDVLRERGNIYLEQSAKDVPHVLTFEAEVVRDGRTLERPVNYALVRIIPPAGTRLDPAKAPIIVVDPRAGHGPGIGGMKQDSEIGVAMAACSTHFRALRKMSLPWKSSGMRGAKPTTRSTNTAPAWSAPRARRTICGMPPTN